MEKGMGNPLQYSCLENYMDGEDWMAIAHGILQARILEWVAHFLLQGIFLTQASNLRLKSPALAGVFFTTSAI